MKWYLDFGHGGKDSGALGKFSKESDVALKIGSLIKNSLEKLKEFYVLKKTTIPDILIEIYFISNIEFEKNISNNYFLENIANTISNELLSFVNKETKNKNYIVCV
ncbi:N-acetylmuramoyl-L-alanine amidase [Romboutsia sp. 1001713B170131_170501_G6]|uniref:N-acetylmuramoyl-L-alanine amidase n=1 Tax=Romboutsia sp. 1001713B170131_170501_G6 TaxID=2787108 RepID=UPI0018A99B7E|nr:N-acetylmuramoyl-L-alanine amidase [Romboutsia sp. 1001713B170131_170501_G6]